MMNRVKLSKKARDRSSSVEIVPGALKLWAGTCISEEDFLNAAMVFESSFSASNMQIGRPSLSRRPVQWEYWNVSLS